MNRSKKLMFAAISAVALVSLSSCNRGYGCPNEFSVADITTLAQTILSFIF